MPRRNIEAIETIHRACRVPLLRVLDGITPAQLTWKPAGDSRSIGEIMRHLIRVDNWFLKRLGFDPKTGDKKDATADELKSMWESTFGQIDEILAGFKDDQQLTLEVPAEDAYRSPGAVFLHQSQHYQYHLAQMVYLRRAQDRTWDAPLKEWEHGTDVIAETVWKRTT